MKYGYLSQDEQSDIDIKAAFNESLARLNLELDSFMEDEQFNKVHWAKRGLKDLIEKKLKAGDVLISYEPANLARSTLQILEIIELLAKKEIQLHLLKSNEVFLPNQLVDTENFLHFIQIIENDFVARRTTDALARRRAQGLPLGRPKGRRNKARKLDKHLDEIKRYLALNISKASIAKLVGCHAQTLYNYIDDRDLVAEVAKERDCLLQNKVLSSTEEKSINNLD